MGDYVDARVECTAEGVRLRGYYFPWGTKRIAYGSIRAVRRVEMGALTGRARVWGTANPRYWTNFDPTRPTKTIALILDLGRHVKPFITPDDPGAVEALIRERANLGPGTDASSRSPLI
jgi:hypothetical protein